MEINGSNMLLEFKTKVDLYSEPKSEKDKPRLIKKGIIIKHQWDIDDVSKPEQILNSKGSIIKNKCRVFVKNYGDVVIEHSYEYICALKEQNHKTTRRTPIGFLKGIKTKR